MSTLKVDKLQGTSGSATALTLNGAASTFNGVHTVGNNAIYTSDGGAVTQNLVQGLAKAWVLGTNAAALTDSFNIASGTDQGTGYYDYAFTNNFGSANYSAAGVCAEGAANFMISAVRSTSVSTQKILTHAGNAADVQNNSNICGDLA